MAGLPRWRYQCGIIHNWQTNGYDGDKAAGGNGHGASPAVYKHDTPDASEYGIGVDANGRWNP
jgi:hypothetical protein